MGLESLLKSLNNSISSLTVSAQENSLWLLDKIQRRRITKEKNKREKESDGSQTRDERNT